MTTPTGPVVLPHANRATDQKIARCTRMELIDSSGADICGDLPLTASQRAAYL